MLQLIYFSISSDNQEEGQDQASDLDQAQDPIKDLPDLGQDLRREIGDHAQDLMREIENRAQDLMKERWRYGRHIRDQDQDLMRDTEDPKGDREVRDQILEI